MIENQILVKIDQFDGPLALLLHLVQKEEMAIGELDLTKITTQYLDYLKKMQELNFDVAGEFLFMAATLIHLKSQTCITETEQKKEGLGIDDLEISSRSNLIQRLEELQRFQKLGERIWSLPKRDQDIFVRPKVDRKALSNSILAPMELPELMNVMMDLMRRESRKYTLVKRDRLSIKEKLIFLRQTLQKGQQYEFSKLIDLTKGIDEIVITLISLLEMARLRRVAIFQNEDRGEIYVDVVESLENFDVDQADGFESPAESTPVAVVAPEESPVVH